MTEDKLMRMIAIQKEFKELYGSWNTGLVGITDSRIQLDVKSFQRYFFNNNDYRVTIQPLNVDIGDWIEYSTTKEGVKFIAVEYVGGEK